MKEAQTDRCVLCHLAGPVVPRPRTVYTLRYARCATPCLSPFFFRTTYYEILPTEK